MIEAGDSTLGFPALPALGFLGLEAGMHDGGLRPTPNPTQEWDDRKQVYSRRHSGRFNVLFCDGHVEYLRPAQLFDVSQASIARRWNKDNQPHQDFLQPWP